MKIVKYNGITSCWTRGGRGKVRGDIVERVCEGRKRGKVTEGEGGGLGITINNTDR